MAKQKSFMHLKGNIGDVNFYKGTDGYGARDKGGVDGAKIASDPAYERTRENMAEFGRAAKAARMLRSPLSELLKQVKDRTRSNRLTAVMMAVIKADSTSDRGQRNVIDGEAELLSGFEFNQNSPLDAALSQFTAAINRVTGSLSVSIPSFIPKTGLTVPDGTTHFKLVSAGLEVDFASGECVKEITETGLIPVDMNPTTAITLENTVTGNSTHPLILVAGIVFFQQVNGKMYPLKSGSFNSLSIVKVSGL
jgi:hypothetical protein